MNTIKNTIKKRVRELTPDLIDSIKMCVEIPSVIGESTDKYPFGKDIDDCLRSTLKLCEGLGFKTFYGDGYYGYAEIGEGDEMVGILGHLDVVPAGELSAWNTDPFELIETEDKLYGRGTQDDKGPTIACLYAVKALMDSGVTFNKKIRFIFGVDEETLWRDMAKYNENNETIPDFGFTPDCTFPMVNAEKGLLQCLLTSKNSSSIELTAGDAFNAVPSKAVYKDKNSKKISDELNRLGFDHKISGNQIEVKGMSVHSQVCNEGTNAISRLLIALNNLGYESNAVKFVGEVIKEDCFGEEIIRDCKDDVSGNLTVNVGKVEIKSGNETLCLDLRIPVTQDYNKVIDALSKKASEYGLTYEEYDFTRPIYLPEDHFLIKTLRRIYEEETGLDSTPESTGGATYARAINNCVAFGAIFPGSEKTEHQPNEYIPKKDLIKATEIYALSLYELTR